VDVGVILDVDEDDQPVMGCVHDIYVVNESQVIFKIIRFSTTFEPHFRAYSLNQQEASIFVPSD